jgi:hypothetical protein
MSQPKAQLCLKKKKEEKPKNSAPSNPPGAMAVDLNRLFFFEDTIKAL